MNGIITAVITPFKNGKLDVKAFEKIATAQVKSGISGITIGGTTGESPNLSHDEIHEMVCIVIDARGKNDFKIIVGAGSNSTMHVMENMRNLEKSNNIDAALIVMPYYNKPTQEGLRLHFEAIAQSASMPIMLYNVPGRTVTDLKPETLAVLAKNPKIIGIKDASDDVARMYQHRKLISSPFIYFSGDDFTFPEFYSAGGVGLISVASNIIPEIMNEIHNLCVQKKYEEATRENVKYYDLYSLMFAETNPMPVKYAMHLLGFCENEYRLPLCPPLESTCMQVKSLLKNLKLI